MPPESPSPSSSEPVTYFPSSPSEASESSIAAVTEWAKLSRIPLSSEDAAELATMWEGHMSSFSEISVIDTRGVFAPGAEDPSWT